MRRRLWTLLLFSATLGVSACDQTAGAGATVTPNGRTSGDSALQPEGGFEGESIDELAIRLDRLVVERDAQISAANTDAGKCEDLCELSRAICDVKSKMCEIADDHVSDDEYQDLCRKAKQRCREASESCVRCVQHHEQSTPLTPAPDCSGAEGEAADPPKVVD